MFIEKSIFLLLGTYLLALTIGELEYSETFVETKLSKKISVRIYTTSGSKHLGQFALYSAKNSLELYQKNFDIDYPRKYILNE
jgi:aminopeptidase 2